MHLYLSNNNLTREIPDITLHDGYIPVIGNHRPRSDQDDDKPIYIEPAVWFKVLVLDSITIDCVKRKIKWISSDVTGETQQFSKLVGDTKVVLRKPRKRISKMQYIEEEYYDYQSNMDDLFEKSKDVMQALSDLKITAHQFDDTILQLLHCYVLPSIKLTVDDIPEVEAAYETMEHIITEKDNEIIHRNEDVERQKNALKRLRDTLLEELESGDCVFPLELQDVLLQDIEEDIQQCWKEFVNLQQKVEDSKCQSCRENLNQQAENFEHVLSASDVCTECQSGIEEKRRKRDEHHEHYLSTIQARENLKNMSQSVKKPIKKKKVPTATLR